MEPVKPPSEIFTETASLLKELNFNIIAQDQERPWGGFFVIDESQAQQFAQHFFADEDFAALKIADKLSPKLLLVAPGKRLSWQYHFRRAEIWRCIAGSVAVFTSKTDVPDSLIHLEKGDKVKLQQGDRHRLVGKDDWGIVAEIWQHTDAANPSNEADIVRLQDDFGR